MTLTTTRPDSDVWVTSRSRRVTPGGITRHDVGGRPHGTTGVLAEGKAGRRHVPERSVMAIPKKGGYGRRWRVA